MSNWKVHVPGNDAVAAVLYRTQGEATKAARALANRTGLSIRVEHMSGKPARRGSGKAIPAASPFAAPKPRKAPAKKGLAFQAGRAVRNVFKRNPSRRYHTLVLFEGGKWSPQHGDYSKAAITEERKDWIYGGYKPANLKIITTGETQAEINAAVKALNSSR